MNIVYIMRGPSGSGKSTVADKLKGEKGVIHSTDNYFVVDGKYQFDFTKLQEYHARNLNAFCESLEKGVEVVICDNTNIKREHYQPYVNASRRAGYLFAFVVMPKVSVEVATKRSRHGVSSDIIRKAYQEMED